MKIKPNEITITIEGPQGCGKTQLGDKIEKMLGGYNVPCCRLTEGQIVVRGDCLHIVELQGPRVILPPPIAEANFNEMKRQRDELQEGYEALQEEFQDQIRLIDSFREGEDKYIEEVKILQTLVTRHTAVIDKLVGLK